MFFPCPKQVDSTVGGFRRGTIHGANDLWDSFDLILDEPVTIKRDGEEFELTELCKDLHRLRLVFPRGCGNAPVGGWKNGMNVIAERDPAPEDEQIGSFPTYAKKAPIYRSGGAGLRQQV